MAVIPSSSSGVKLRVVGSSPAVLFFGRATVLGAPPDFLGNSVVVFSASAGGDCSDLLAQADSSIAARPNNARKAVRMFYAGLVFSAVF